MQLYEQIEKEFDEFLKQQAEIDISNGFAFNNQVYAPDVKSFLKQSFIRFLEEQVKDEQDKIRFIGEATYCQFCKQHIAAGECDCNGWNEAKIDTISRYQNMIKELHDK